MEGGVFPGAGTSVGRSPGLLADGRFGVALRPADAGGVVLAGVGRDGAVGGGDGGAKFRVDPTQAGGGKGREGGLGSAFSVIARQIFVGTSALLRWGASPTLTTGRLLARYTTTAVAMSGV